MANGQKCLILLFLQSCVCGSCTQEHTQLQSSVSIQAKEIPSSSLPQLLSWLSVAYESLVVTVTESEFMLHNRKAASDNVYYALSKSATFESYCLSNRCWIANFFDLLTHIATPSVPWPLAIQRANSSGIASNHRFSYFSNNLFFGATILFLHFSLYHFFVLALSEALLKLWSDGLSMGEYPGKSPLFKWDKYTLLTIVGLNFKIKELLRAKNHIPTVIKFIAQGCLRPIPFTYFRVTESQVAI